MALTSSQVWQRIQAEGLADESQCQQWNEQLAGSLSQEELQDGISVLKGLMEISAISNYQARILAGKSNDPLRFGKWVILGRAPGDVWKDWLQVRRTVLIYKDETQSTTADTIFSGHQDVLWGRWLNAATVKQFGGTKSLMFRLKQWSQLNSDRIQRAEEPEIENNRLMLRVSPIHGRPLSQCVPEAAQNSEQVLQIVQTLATALAALHQRQVVYGNLRPDRVFWDPAHGVSLACEPADPRAIVKQSQSSQSSQPSQQAEVSNPPSLLQDALGELPGEMFVAPEILNRSQSHSFSSDVYSLGSLWWWLLDRLVRPGSRATRNEQVLDCDHLQMPQPLAKILSRCIAMQPAARFADADKMREELEAAKFGPLSAAVERKSPSRTSKSAGRRRRTVSLFLPLIATTFFLGLALAVMAWSGVFSSGNSRSASDSKQSQAKADQLQAEAAATNPLTKYYQLVESQNIPWAPPLPPRPIDLQLLPPGVQLLATFHPSRISKMSNISTLLRLFGENQPLAQWLDSEFQAAGVPAEEMYRATIALYSPSMAALTNETPQPPTGQQFQSEFPDLFLRIELHQPIDLDRLKSSWNLQPDAITDSRGVIPIDDRRSVYLPPIDLLDHPKDRHGVQVFCIGPKALVEEAAELEGASAPISLALKKLLDRSNRDFDFSLLTTPRFLFSDGQAVLQALPPRMQQLLESMLGRESRGLLVQSHSNGQWYWEAQALGAKDSEAADMLKNWTQQASQASSQAEQRLLHENPHPFWRALALRFPQMLRIWYQSSRFGIEDGVVLANGYLPATAPSNLAAATWISMQDGALLATTPESGNSGPLSDVTMTPDSQSAAPLDMKEFLNRQIRLSFEQEPIEQALALIGEEANDSLPAGVRKVRFELDGSAFEKAGITRNQQIRQFKAEGISVRQALTELARRGNPASNVSDTRDTKQMLVWIVKQVPSINENGIVMLTTRDQALSEHYVLPEEFAEVKQD